MSWTSRCGQSAAWPAAGTTTEQLEASRPKRVQRDKQRGEHLGRVAGDEVIHGLLLGEARDGGQHAKRVAAEQDEVLGVGAHAGYARVGDVVDRVRRARVLRHSAAGHSHTSRVSNIIKFETWVCHTRMPAFLNAGLRGPVMQSDFNGF